MEITIDLMQLLIVLLIIAGIAIGVFLVLMLIRLIGTLKRASKLLDQINDPLTKSMNQLPELIKKVDGISDNVVSLTASVNESLPSIIKDAKTITETTRDGVVAVGSAVKSVGNGVSSMFQPEESSNTDTLGSILNIIGQVIGVVSYFTTEKKGNRKKRK